jgi:hypothetical protein
VAEISEEDRNNASIPTKGVTFATGDDDDDDDGAAPPPRASTPTPEDDVENPEQIDTIGEVLTPPPTLPTNPANDLRMMHGLVRSTRKLNIDTGTTNSRECTVTVVGGLVEPMNPLERRRKEFLNKKEIMTQISSRTDARETQYRLRSKTVSNKNETEIEGKSMYHSYSHFLFLFQNGRDSETSTGGSVDPTDKWILAEAFNRYVHWSFQTSFQQLVYSLVVIFYLLTCLWAVAIYGVGHYQPNCIYVGDLDFETAGSHFIDAYAVSWTTFSTVVSKENASSIPNMAIALSHAEFLSILVSTFHA